MLKKIISGGQTGVDRAALDVAILLNIAHGGWCPKGRLAEDGELDKRYLLIETETSDYSERTKLNIRDSDATLICIVGTIENISDGTILTLEEVKRNNKIFLLIDILKNDCVVEVQDWLISTNIKTLNIAGPRESQSVGIYDSVFTILMNVFENN